MSTLYKEIKFLVKKYNYLAGTSTSMLNELQEILNYHGKELDDENLDNKDYASEDMAKSKGYAPLEPRMFCTNCGQKFEPVPSSSEGIKNAGYYVPGINDKTEQVDDEVNMSSLAVELDSEYPKYVDYLNADINLLQEVYFNKRLPTKTKKIIMKELQYMIDENARKLIKGLD
jgi:hypothetical protein